MRFSTSEMLSKSVPLQNAIDMTSPTDRAANRRRFLLHPASGPAILLGGILLAGLANALLPTGALRDIAAEQGWVQRGSALGYLLAAAAMLAGMRRLPPLFGLGAVLTMLLGARELDAHKAFTTNSMLKLPYYTRPTAQIDGAEVVIPLAEKLVAGGAVLVILALLVLFAIRNGPRLRAGLKARSPAAVSMLAFLVWLPVTKLWDSGPRVLRDGFGIDFTES